jgi:myo-inositol-1(or 4)-monophosphatase
MTPDLEKICLSVCEIARETGIFIKSEAGKQKTESIETKGLNDFVTLIDKAAEKKLITSLEKLIPDAGYIAEENSRTNKGEKYNWIIDPIDGTTNFIHGIPCYSISIALMRDEKIVLGMVYEINMNECFYAWEGSKAYLNGKEITVTNASTLAASLLATGFPYSDYERFTEYMNLFTDLMHKCQGIRRLGSAAVDLAYVACGRFEGFYEYGLKSWDVAAGAFLVQQAGGKVTDFKGREDFIFGKEIVAGNSLMFKELLEKVQKYFHD